MCDLYHVSKLKWKNILLHDIAFTKYEYMIEITRMLINKNELKVWNVFKRKMRKYFYINKKMAHNLCGKIKTSFKSTNKKKVYQYIALILRRLNQA